MPSPMIEQGARNGQKPKKSGTSIRTGVVINNCELISQGKVLVRIPELNMEVWARLTGPGGGANTGLFYPPNADDEVLLALDHEQPQNAFVLAGLWNTRDTPPNKVPTPVANKRVLRTGLTQMLGHEIEFDDLSQSITITSSTKQVIAIKPTSIEVTATGGKVSVELTPASATIKAPIISLESDGAISLDAKVIKINGSIETEIQGKIVRIN